MTVYVPPIKIQGIKTKLVPIIRQNVVLDEKSVWVEPFMGSGVVGFNIAPRKAVFADKNPHIIDFYNYIKSGNINSGIVREYMEHEGQNLSEGDDSYYYEVRTRFNREHNPLDFLFLNRSCYNGVIRFNRNYEFNVPYGHKPQRFAKAYITKIVHQVSYIEEKLKENDWVFLCQDFQQTIAEADSNSFIYCDPPYIGRHVDYYDSWDADSEAALCKSLTDSTARFMLSTWDHNDFRSNEYINTTWSFCNKVTTEHFYHVGAKEANRNPMIEALLMNYSSNTSDS